MTQDEMLKLFQGLNELDKRSFFVYMSFRIDSSMGAGTFEKYFKEYLDLSVDQAK